jgi:hypothetical protein
MHLHAVVSVFIIFLKLVISSSPDSTLVRRSSLVIVDACQNVNNATNRFRASVGNFLTSGRHPSDQNILNELASFFGESENLIDTLKKNGDNIYKGQGAVTEKETVEVIKLRNHYYNSELPDLSSKLMNIADFYSLELYSQDGVSSLLGRTVAGHDTASTAFASRVIAKLPERYRGSLKDLDRGGQKLFQTLIEHLQKAGRTNKPKETASSTASERDEIRPCPTSNVVTTDFTFCTD